MSENLKNINNVLLTKNEIAQAYNYLFEEFGPIVQIWTEDKKNEKIAEFWIHNGKKKIT